MEVVRAIDSLSSYDFFSGQQRFQQNFDSAGDRIFDIAANTVNRYCFLYYYNKMGSFSIEYNLEAGMAYPSVGRSQVFSMQPEMVVSSLGSYETMLLDAKNILGIRISELASLLDVSRPTIYSYLSGQEPSNKDVQDKIFHLTRIVQIIKENNLETPCLSLLHQMDSDGNSLATLVKQNKDVEEFAIRACNSEIALRKARMKRSIQRKSTKSVNPESFSIPAYHEDGE